MKPTTRALEIISLFDKRVVICMLLLVAIAFSFWGSSRYPSLDNKALMGGQIALDDALSFDSVWKLPESPTVVDKITATFANWIYVNWKGMGFGLAIAIVIMSLLPLILKYLPQRASTATLAGMIVGVPLGLCVNCSAPVAYGLHQRGSRGEMALATMLSSPALNIVVLGMAISLLPWYYYATKIGLSLILVLFLVPLILRFWPMPEPPEVSKNILAPKLDAETVYLSDTGTWINAIRWLLNQLWTQSIWLVTRMVPLMLLAGLLGAICVTLLPWEEIVSLLPRGNITKVVATMAGLGLFALILPVPIAFDVILVVTLVAAGVSHKYAGVLLFALGSYSVYSYFVIYKAGARATANAIAGAILLLSIGGGLLTHYLAKVDYKYVQAKAIEYLLEANPDPPMNTRDNSGSFTQTDFDARFPWVWDSRYPDEVKSVPFLTQNQAVTGKMVLITGDDIGIKSHHKSLIDLQILPFNHTGSTASGDLDNDGWPDLVTASTSGVQVFSNQQGKFAHRIIPGLQNSAAIVGSVALVDLDNNGWLDIAYVAFKDGFHVSYNREGRFEQPVKLSTRASLLPLAMAFSDINNDGILDIVIGHHNGLGWKIFSIEESRNELLLSGANGYTSIDLSGIPAETLSILASDFNGDQFPDVWIGNDFDEPDVFYIYNPDSRKLEETREMIEHTTVTTMSMDIGDIDNDLNMETYQVQITRNPLDGEPAVAEKDMSEFYNDHCTENTSAHCEVDRKNVIASSASRKSGPGLCYALEGEDRNQCIVMSLFRRNIQGRGSKQQNACKLFKDNYPDHLFLCDLGKKRKYNRTRPAHSKFSDGIPQVKNTNILLEWSKEKFSDISKGSGTRIAGWAWNAKFADLDSDTLQDIFVVNGFNNYRVGTTNAWFKNTGNRQFIEESARTGLTDHESTPSYTYIDYDLDGDLDLITQAHSGRIRVYNNQLNNNNNIQFELNDELGNRSGIGSRIVIRYGSDEQQIRELKASGGFLSFDPLIAHFGLGKHSEINSVMVHWSTGDTVEYPGPFQSGKRYRISRTQN